ncbi:MAG TPA: S24 family peptidase, partial [Anaerolineae bacterium]|nr:S24 family peptidase [Anaerolineae bacterium]
IAASDLDDEDRMVRHFRRLAGYLHEPSLRDRVRDDRSWFERGRDGMDEEAPLPFRIVFPEVQDRNVTCIPLLPLHVAAGAFSEPDHTLYDDCQWVAINTHRDLAEGMFVAQVVGRSMEPAIPDGSYCLFRAPVVGSRNGRTVLVQLRDSRDPESGERYTVKRYASKKVTADDGTWRHVRILLKPINPEFEPIELLPDSENDVMVLAELLEVLR